MTPIPPDAARIMITRRKLLEILNMLYPVGMRCDALMRCVIPVEPSYDMTLLTKDVHYLVGKKYIEYVDDRIGGMPTFAAKVVTLTPAGKDIADRIVVDPTLEI